MSDGRSNLTLRQRLRLQHSAGDAADGTAGLDRGRRRLAAAAAIVVLIAGGAWAWIHFHDATDPRLQEILDLQAKISRLDSPMGKESFDLRRQIWEKMKDLPDDLKGAVRRNHESLFQARFDRFFAMSSKDQLAELDKFILAMQAMQQMQQLKNAIAGQSGSGSGNSSGKPPARAGRSDAQRVQWMQNMISSHTPQQRAQWNLGRQMFQARMQQQGIQPPGGFF